MTDAARQEPVAAEKLECRFAPERHDVRICAIHSGSISADDYSENCRSGSPSFCSDAQDVSPPLQQFRERMEAAKVGGYCMGCERPFAVPVAAAEVLDERKITDEMVERAAISLALAEAACKGSEAVASDFYETIEEADRDEWRKTARAALEAAFTPPEKP